MSSNKQTKKSLRLLEKLVQENGDGETNPERQILYDGLIKETGGGSFYEKMNGNYVDKNRSNENGLQRKSRQRVRKKPPSKTSKNYATKTEEKESISIPLADNQKNGHRSRSNSKSSTSSFWSSRSRSRSRSPSNRSRSRSITPPRKRERSRSPSDRSRSRSITPPRRRERSRSLSMSSSRSRSRSLSSSKSRSSSHGSSHSVPSSKTNNLKAGAPNLKQRDTVSEQGKNGVNNRTGKKKKLLHRSPMRKFRSMEINPDLFIEEKLNRKYQELKDLVHSNFGDSRPQVTRKYLYQMEVLRDQYKKVSHGLPPSGLLLPADIPSGNGRRTQVNTRKHRGKVRPQSANSAGTSSFGEDNAYGTIYSVMTGSIAREQNFIRTDVHAGHRPRPKSKKKNLNKQKRKDSQSTLDTHDYSSLDKTPSGSILSKTNSSPRSHLPPDPTDHHIKYSNNPKLLSWLKKKDNLYRKQKKEEKMKRRDEREKAVMEVNEKFERRLESQKKVKEWMDVKKKESRMRSREERQRKKEDAAIINSYHLKTTPGAALKNEKLSGKGIRPQSAPSARKGNNSDMNTENGELNGEDNPENIKERIHKTREEEEEKKQALLNEKVSRQGPHPPASKFVYKRPVAGRIKLNIRPKSASTPQQDKSKSPERGRDGSNNTRLRMSYEDWLSEKRKQDQLRKAEIKLQQEELAKSDPELAKIVPDIAKKRIHRVLEGKKSIDTGLKRHDEKVNNSFGGGNFNSEESDGDSSPTRFSYRLEQDRPASSRKANPKALKVAGQGMRGTERPQTAPPRSGQVPAPKISSSSPRKAVVPAKSEKSDEVSSAFKLPFPEEEGIPKHVASVQRKLFAEKVWSKLEENEERPEPQGCDSSERPVCPQTDNSVKTEAAKNDSVGKVTNEDVHKNVPENTVKEEVATEVTSDGDLTEDGGQQEMQEPGYAFFVTERTEDQVQEEVKTTETVNEKQENQTDDVNQNNITEDSPEDDVGLTLRPQSSMNTSRTGKRVSFCEETEILGRQEEADDGQVDWSTDTATPDEEDYVAFHAQRDLSADTEQTLDSFGQELNNSGLELPSEEASREQTTGENEDFENKSSSDEDSADEEVALKDEEGFEENSASPDTFETENKVKDSLDDEF